MTDSAGCQGTEIQRSVMGRNVPDILDKEGYQLRPYPRGQKGGDLATNFWKLPDCLQLSGWHIILSLSVWPVLVMFLQRNRANRMCIYRKEFYFKELAHVTVEANPKAVSWQNSSLLERWGCRDCSVSTLADWMRPSHIMERQLNFLQCDAHLKTTLDWMAQWAKFHPCESFFFQAFFWLIRVHTNK